MPLKDTIFLDPVDVSSENNQHRFKSQNDVISGATRAVTDSSTVGAETVGFLFAVIIIFEAEAAVLPATDILITLFGIIKPAIATVLTTINEPDSCGL